MPVPFEDFNCGKYFIVPKKYLELDREQVNRILSLGINKALEAMIGWVDCEIKLSEISITQENIKYVVKFNVMVFGKDKQFTQKPILVAVDLEQENAELLCS